MRVWLNPELMAARELSAGEVVAALRANNIQVASGSLNQLPVPDPGAFQLSVETLVDRIQHLVPTPDGGDDFVGIGCPVEGLRI